MKEMLTKNENLNSIRRTKASFPILLLKCPCWWFRGYVDAGHVHKHSTGVSSDPCWKLFSYISELCPLTEWLFTKSRRRRMVINFMNYCSSGIWKDAKWTKHVIHQLFRTAHKFIIDDWTSFYLFCLRSSDHDLKTRLAKKDAQGTFFIYTSPLQSRR